jgi:hypothetical protein
MATGPAHAAQRSGDRRTGHWGPAAGHDNCNEGTRMKRTTGARIVAVAAVTAAVACGALATSAAATTQPTTAPSAVSTAATPTEFCPYTPRGSVSHYFSLASGQRVVKGEYTHGQDFLIGLPPTRFGLDGITYWKLPNGFWIDSAGIVRVTGPCATP